MENKEKLSFQEELFQNFKVHLLEQLNIKESLTDEELKQNLVFIIKQYEIKFKDIFSDIFKYEYVRNILNTGTMDKIINFVKHKGGIDEQKKEEIIQSERKNCLDVLNLYGLEKTDQPNTYVSTITGLKIILNNDILDIINNNDIFLIKPKGKPELMGPHALYTLEYSENYWESFKQNIQAYIQNIKNQEYIEDLKDYYFWLTCYHAFNNILKENTQNKGGKHVKN